MGRKEKGKMVEKAIKTDLMVEKATKMDLVEKAAMVVKEKANGEECMGLKEMAMDMRIRQTREVLGV